MSSRIAPGTHNDASAHALEREPWCQDRVFKKLLGALSAPLPGPAIITAMLRPKKPALALLLASSSLIAWVAMGQTRQTTFEFHSGMWLNLHHTLYYQAVGIKAGRVPDLSALSSAETGVWNQALHYYGRSLVNHNLLEVSMARINQALANAANASDLQAPGLSREMDQVLEAAAPIYRARFWADHDRNNQEWIASAIPLIAKHEDALKPALARAYDTPWPKSPIRVEVSYYVTGNSAYTSLNPTLITVSSGSQRNQGPALLENIFHEGGHALIQKAFAEITKAEKSQKKELKYRDVWHALMFYTTGELVRKQVPELEPYAMKYGLWEDNWPQVLPMMEKDWKPFLEGKGAFKDGIRQLVADSPAR